MIQENKDELVPDNKRIVVTSALPYANGDIHLGHLVEVVQTDIFVRFKKMSGCNTVYVCADDTHGTPIQLKAQERGITCEQLIEEAWKNHVKDYAQFSIDFDIFYSTNSPENKKWAEYIFSKLEEKQLLIEKEIEQYFCQHCNRFLPDRFIRGGCPKCGKDDQYGDVCESCGATYDPIELHNPTCATCKSKPILKRSTHFFVELAKAESFLRKYLTKTNVLQDDMYNFVVHWIDEGLKEWCISRDGPYFGFKIPHTENKYFYVWLDAPIGYISATEKWCSANNVSVQDIWSVEAASEIYHFIGKDIVYFHTLFWPVMLNASSLKTPTKVFVHGFLTVEGEKMSKSRGTFILARDYSEKMKHPYAREYLRFYYGSKLMNNASDIDLNFDEFCTKVNTTLINNFGNLHHRTFIFLDRYFQSHVPDMAWDESLAQEVEGLAADIELCFNRVEFKRVIDKIQALSSLGNKYYQDMKPWELMKQDKNKAAVVMVTCVNIVKACAVFLKPFIPNIITTLEKQYGKTFQWKDYRFSLRNCTMGKTEKIGIPILKEDFSALYTCLGKEEKLRNTIPDDKTLINIDQFKNIDIRIGKIKKSEKIKKSDKLIKLIIEDGDSERTIISGLGKSYGADSLTGKTIVFVANLKPVKIMGHMSEGMVLAASSGGKLSLLQPDTEMEAGAVVS